MGAFLVNFHVRSTERDAVASALREFSVAEAWIAEPHEGWITFWEKLASGQNPERIRYLGKSISQSLNAAAIAFMVHDSDVLAYWLFDGGDQLDEYNSCPDYWGVDEGQDGDEDPKGDCDVLVKYCRAGTTPAQLLPILARTSPADFMSTNSASFLFAEDRLTKLAPFLGLRLEVVLTDVGGVNPFTSNIAIMKPILDRIRALEEIETILRI